MNDLGFIVSQIQHNDLSAEEARIKLERDKRKALRLQAGGNVVSINELLTKISGSLDEKLDATMEVKTEEAAHATRTGGGFPPPPSGPTSHTGT
jgi:hypothetical protein